MPLRLILIFAVTEFLLCLTPGPAVLLVVSQAVKNGSRASLRGAAGILTGNVFYFVLSALGLGALLISSATLFQIIRWAGAVYLVFVGVRLLATRRPAAVAYQGAPSTIPSMRLFSQGLLTQLSNPKAIIFFSALLPQFVSMEQSVVGQFIVLGVISIAIEFLVLSSYGWAAERGSRRFLKGQFSLLTDRIAGGFLVCAGLGLAATRR
jgi:homoserine/homoserine lactone efflux protein